MLENKNFAAVSAKSAATVDEGLRQYMIKVYNYMAAGLCLTAFAAYLVANTSLIRLFFNITPQGASLSGLGWLFLLAPFLMILLSAGSSAAARCSRFRAYSGAFRQLWAFLWRRFS